MKLELKQTGSAKISRQELTKIVSEWVERTQKLKVKKAIYQDGMDGMILEVYKEPDSATIPQFPDKKIPKSRKSTSGHVRKNKGIFKFIRDYVSALRKDGYVSISFDEFYKDTLESYPEMEKSRLELYLWDKRQLKGIKYKSSTGTIHF